MGIQIVSETELAKAQQVVIAEVRYTAEYNAPCPNLVEKFTLRQGEKQITVPKVGQMDATALTDGQDMTSSEDIGMTSVDLTTGEVGLKVILTDKLIRQEKAELYRVIGRQMGDAMARKKDKDIIALFDDFTADDLGGTTKTLSLANLAGCITYARVQKFPQPIAVVHRPETVYDLTSAITITTAALFPMPHGYAEDLLKDFWALTFDGIAIIRDGNIAKNAGSVTNDAYGAIFSKAALCIVESLAPRTERERDASLRATEVVMVSDYGCFVLDDSYGATMLYDATTVTTNA